MWATCMKIVTKNEIGQQEKKPWLPLIDRLVNKALLRVYHKKYCLQTLLSVARLHPSTTTVVIK